MRWDPYPPPSRGQSLSLRERGSELRAGSLSEAGPQAIRSLCVGSHQFDDFVDCRVSP